MAACLAAQTGWYSITHVLNMGMTESDAASAPTKNQGISLPSTSRTRVEVSNAIPRAEKAALSAVTPPDSSTPNPMPVMPGRAPGNPPGPKRKNEGVSAGGSHHKRTSRWAVPGGPGRICTRAFWQSDDSRNVASTPRNRFSALDPYMNRVAPSSPTSFPSYSPSPCLSITSVSRVSRVHRSSSGSVDGPRCGGDSRTMTACSYTGRRGGLLTRD